MCNITDNKNYDNNKSIKIKLDNTIMVVPQKSLDILDKISTLINDDKILVLSNDSYHDVLFSKILDNVPDYVCFDQLADVIYI